MDERTRRSERDASLGDPEASAKALRQRLRQGALSQAQLRLLAYLGEPGAQEALGERAPIPPTTVVDWAQGLTAYGPRAVVRAAVAVLRATLPAWERDAISQRRLRPVLHTVERWLLDPDPERLTQIRRQTDLLSDEEQRWLQQPASLPRPCLGGLAGSDLGAAACSAAACEAGDESRPIGGLGAILGQLIARLPEPERQRTIVRQALAAWTLGEDPVARRHQAPGSARPLLRLRPQPVSVREPFLLRAGETLCVGRSGAGVDVELFAPGVSRRHLRLTGSAAGDAFLEDLHSASGAALNQRRALSGIPWLLLPGDRVALGGIELAVEAPDD